MLALSIACLLAALVWAYLVVGHGAFWRAAEWLPATQGLSLIHI